jgi:hypothetical protein
VRAVQEAAAVLAIADELVLPAGGQVRGRHGSEAAVADAIDDRDDGAAAGTGKAFEPAAHGRRQLTLQLLDAGVEVADGFVDVDVELAFFDLGGSSRSRGARGAGF